MQSGPAREFLLPVFTFTEQGNAYLHGMKVELSPQFLDHVALRVADLEKSAEWYCAVLGLQRVAHPDTWGPFPIMVLAGESGIALFPKNETPSLPKETAFHLAFRVPTHEFSAWRTRLESFGVAVDFQAHPPFQSFFFRDPDGYQIELTAQIAAPKAFGRTLVVADIHGAFRALEQVLERAEFSPATDRLISLGDVVDGWPESPESVRFLSELPHCIAIQGNHDAFFQDYLNYGMADDHWLLGEGKSTLEAYSAYGQLHAPLHLQFFNRQIPYYIDEEHRCFVHGGFDLGKSIQQQNPTHLSWNRSMWSEVMEKKGAVTDVNEFKEVFLGHTPTILHFPDQKPVRLGKFTNLDQGAKVIGKLSCVEVESGHFWQSDPVTELYPDHNREWSRFELSSK